MKPTQKERVLAFIRESGGFVTTNDLRHYGVNIACPPIADCRKRADDLIPKFLTKREILPEEMEARKLKTKVTVYHLVEQTSLF